VEHLQRSDSRWGGPRTALLALLALAAALRGAGLTYGLPYGTLLNPDEQSIVPRAWAMVHGGGADPHWFDYPTLLMYLLAPTQLWQPEPSFLAARIVVAVLGVAGVAAAWWLGRAAYGNVAGAVAAAATAVETTHVAYSHMAVTDVPLALGVAAALALAVSGRLELAGLAAGLATGFKYPGAFLLVPIVVAGWGRPWRLAGALGVGVAAFLASSPFLAVHPGQAWDDFSRVGRLARRGWLGFEHDGWAGFAFSSELWHGLGPFVLVAVVGLLGALLTRRRSDLVLVSFVVVYALDLLTLHAHFDRYLLPLVPPLAALAGRVRYLAAVSLLLLVVPLTWSVRNDARLTRTDTRIEAVRWIDAHVPPGGRIAEDPSLPPLPGREVLSLALPGPGRDFDPNRDAAVLSLHGVRWVVVSGAVTDRVLAARDRYPREAAFYSVLPLVAKRAYYVTPGRDLSGPWVAVYHLTS
jgi:4-amino-4-deoxy-L-arabinose transferase-like glycosyltransferase